MNTCRVDPWVCKVILEAKLEEGASSSVVNPSGVVCDGK